jgi:uncharacterized protein YndB with AHSA1/START domain
MKKPTKVQAPEGCAKWLTSGKIYDVVNCENSANPELGHRFNILSDDSDKLICREKSCGHLNGGDWIIIETE